MIMCEIKQPEEEAKEIICQIFSLQHADDNAKMICLSTPKIAEYFCNKMIEELKRESSSDSQAVQYWEEVKIKLQCF